MRNFSEIECLLTLGALLSMFGSCTKPDTVQDTSPFSNGTSDRTMIVVISDFASWGRHYVYGM